MNKCVETVVERISGTNNIFHLIDGEWDCSATFQPIKCGDGIVFPYRETVDISEVCPDCLYQLIKENNG